MKIEDFKPEALRRIHCNSCKGSTNHLIKSSHRIFEEGEDGWWESKECLFLICAGCEQATLMEVYSDASIGDETWDFFHPKRNVSDHQPKRFLKLNPKLKQLYQEVVGCFNHGHYVLCAAGMRALIEGVCDEKGIAGDNLEKKIDGLRMYFPTNNIVDSLHGFRFIGNEAVHQLEAPKQGEARIALGVLEDVLNYLYDLDYKAAKLKYADKRAQQKGVAVSAGEVSAP